MISGYRWDPELRALGVAVISLRDGGDGVIWMHELDGSAGGAVATRTPILLSAGPCSPQIALLGDTGPGDTGREQCGDAGQDR